MKLLTLILTVSFLSACSRPTTDIIESFYNPSPLLTAQSMIGKNERSDRRELRAFLGVDPVRYEWCAAFVNASLYSHGIPGSESVNRNPLMARSFLTYGTEADTPMRGDIVIFPRGNQGWQGHVGFYIESAHIDGVEYYLILGGNQDNSVTYEYYKASKALAVRRVPDQPSFDSDLTRFDTLLAFVD